MGLTTLSVFINFDETVNNYLGSNAETFRTFYLSNCSHKSIIIITNNSIDFTYVRYVIILFQNCMFNIFISGTNLEIEPLFDPPKKFCLLRSQVPPKHRQSLSPSLIFCENRTIQVIMMAENQQLPGGVNPLDFLHKLAMQVCEN